MKRICLFLIAIMLLALPSIAFAEGTDPAVSESPEATPVPTPTPTPTLPPSPTAEPTTAPTPVVDQLYIDSTHLYDGMDKTYEQGYVPAVANGKAIIVLPLIGQTYSGAVNLKADLGSPANSPFQFGNYSQSVNGHGLYVFTLEIPLVGGRINGSYPVVLTAEYLDVTGTKASQDFTVYVTITDGATPTDPNAQQQQSQPGKETNPKPELFISSCIVSPTLVGGDAEFSVEVVIENIGKLRARSVRLTYGGVDNNGIVPVETNNALHLDNLADGATIDASFKLKTTKDVLAGNQPFSITLDYVDLYGGVYSVTRQFLIAVTQPAEIGYDPIAAPKSITAGETMTLPANVFNIGKSTLRNVTVTASGAGLFPTSSVFLGDILPGTAGYGELKIFIGMLSMTEGYNTDYGKTTGKYTITYYDDNDEEYVVTLDFSTEILKSVIEGENEKEKELTKEPAFQWWVTIIVGLAVIAIIVSVVIVGKFSRMMKMR